MAKKRGRKVVFEPLVELPEVCTINWVKAASEILYAMWTDVIDAYTRPDGSCRIPLKTADDFCGSTAKIAQAVLGLRAEKDLMIAELAENFIQSYQVDSEIEDTLDMPLLAHAPEEAFGLLANGYHFLIFTIVWAEAHS